MNGNFLIFGFVFFIFPYPTFAKTWEKTPQPPFSQSPGQIIAHPLVPGKVFLSSRTEIIEGSLDGGWKGLKIPDLSPGRIQKMVVAEQVPESVFLLTENGAYQTNLAAGISAKIYHGKNPEEKKTIAFAVGPNDPTRWFLGNERGLWQSKDQGKRWTRVQGPWAHQCVSLIFFNKNRLFIGGGETLYLTENLNRFEPVLSIRGIMEREIPDDPGNDPEALAVPGEYSFTSVVRHPQENSRLWVGTRRGVFISQDSGFHWTRLPLSGLRDPGIRDLALAPESEQLFAATRHGVYEYRAREGIWAEKFKGLTETEAFSLASVEGNPPRLAAVTREGLVYYPLNPEPAPAREPWLPSPEILTLFRQLTSLEPTAAEIHRAVLKFSDLKIEKIKRWHWQSRMSSLFPKLTLAKKLARTNNIDLDRGGTNDPDIYITGPEDISRDVSLNLGWDFSSLAWSSNQTSIDVRAKLMIDQRHELLAEATRIYYERRRIQTEILFSPETSEKDHLGKLIRLDELTSLLDAMTDGFFSKRIESIYAQHPGLYGLWEFRGSAEGVWVSPSDIRSSLN